MLACRWAAQTAGDRFHRQGAYLYPDNCCYIGQWERGLKHGQGTYWDAQVRGAARKGMHCRPG